MIIIYLFSLIFFKHKETKKSLLQLSSSKYDKKKLFFFLCHLNKIFLTKKQSEPKW